MSWLMCRMRRAWFMTSYSVPYWHSSIRMASVTPCRHSHAPSYNCYIFPCSDTSAFRALLHAGKA